MPPSRPTGRTTWRTTTATFRHASAELVYTDQGETPLVLLLHSWACDPHDWSWQIPAVLGAGYRVIAIGHRGHGRSTARVGDYTPQATEDELDRLTRRLDADRPPRSQ
ncbi:alpha/beta fold hydrolase [Streptomyces sp. NPDC002896]|uniref:alpha/beta fold hydrolase n=1 Tax=Streptomyces sp. NPDC002896 TaxID=3154438 RepID=UPI00332E6CBF